MGRFANIFDTLQNLVTGLGMQGIDSSVNVQYILNLLDRNTLENMYRADWLARKIIDAPAEDMTREWRAWQANQPQIEALEEVEKTLDLQRKVKQWIIKARLYGGGALVIGADDGNDPSQPIDLKKCGKGCLKYVVVLHRYELNAGPRIYNVSDPYYTRPAYYTVATPVFGMEGERGLTQPTLPGQTASVPGAVKSGWMSNVVAFKNRSKQELQTIPTNMGLTQIHPSRVLELPGNELPDWRLAPLGGGWGDSVLQTVVDEMQSFTTIVRSISAMVSDGKLDVVKIPDMALNLTTPGYKNKLIERFALSAQTKSVISALLLDKEEEWDRVSTQYAGLPMIMHEFITYISGASSIPVSRLFGQAAGRGLSGGSTSGGGEEDLRNYYDNCATEQKNEVAPRLGMLDQVLMRSAIGKDDPNVHYEWNPLWQMSDDEKATIAFKKAQATQIYASIGIINEDAFRQGVVNQLIEDGTYPGLDDAIEEFGSEPEEPDDTGGYQQPGGGGFGPNGGSRGGEPNAAQIGHSGGMDAWFDYEGQPRAASAPGHSSGEFASGSGGIKQISGAVAPTGLSEKTELGAGTGGCTTPEGGKRASPGVPEKLVQAIEDHVNAMGGETGQHGSGDLTEWLMRTHRAEMLKLIDDMPPNKRPTLLLHKGDEATGMPSVWLLGWSLKEGTDIHDHVRSEVGISVLRGKVRNTFFGVHLGDDYLEGSKKPEGYSTTTQDTQLHQNSTVTLQTPYIHEMFGTSDSKASGKRDVTVHAYAPPLKQMHYFKKDAQGRLHYDGDWDEDKPPTKARDHCCAPLLFEDEEPGHPFHGNQYTGSLGAGDIPTLSSMRSAVGGSHEIKQFINSPKVSESLVKTAGEWMLKHALGAAEHITKETVEIALRDAVLVGLMHYAGVPAIAAAPAAVVAGYAMNHISDRLNINSEHAYPLLKAGVTKLRKLREHWERISSSFEKEGIKNVASLLAKSEYPTGAVFGFGDADDAILLALRVFDKTLRSHTADELEEAGRGFKIGDEAAGHPFRGNQHTGGIGGEGEELGHGYSEKAHLDEHGVIQTSDVDDAIRALYEDRKVELNQPRQASVLIDKLGEVAHRMETKGFKGVFDLCNVSIKGSNLFCAEAHGIPRKRMPQLKGTAEPGSPASKMKVDKRGEVDVTDGFVKYLKDKGFATKHVDVDVANMRPTQNELNGAKVGILAKLYRQGKLDVTSPMILSRDDYVLDGHHRWAAMVGVEFSKNNLEGLKIGAERINIGTIQLVQEARRYTQRMGIKQAGVAQIKAS